MGARFTHKERRGILAACKRRFGSTKGKARAEFFRTAVLGHANETMELPAGPVGDLERQHRADQDRSVKGGAS